MAVTGYFRPHPKITLVPPKYKPFLGFLLTRKQTNADNIPVYDRFVIGVAGKPTSQRQRLHLLQNAFLPGAPAST
jgi:hypothetical protein